MLFGILALAIQCFAVQTHVHGDGGTPGGIESSGPAMGQDAANPSSADSNPIADKDSSDTDTSLCSLCWELMDGGHFVLPALLCLFLLFAGPVAVAFGKIVSTSLAPSHNWRGRAPPAV
jgi:hypothetical protein